MDSSLTITFQLEKALHKLKTETLSIFRENKLPISRDQWSILERIAKHEGSSQRDIARDTFKDPAALTRMLDLLVDKGFVQRKPSKQDRRTFVIHLTVEGGRLVKKIAPILDKLNASLEKVFSKDEKKTLALLLQKINS